VQSGTPMMIELASSTSRTHSSLYPGPTKVLGWNKTPAQI